MLKLPIEKKVIRILDNRNSFSLICLALCFLLIFFMLPNPATATDYFVATNGHDTDTGNVNYPRATLDYAIDHIKAFRIAFQAVVA